MADEPKAVEDVASDDNAAVVNTDELFSMPIDEMARKMEAQTASEALEEEPAPDQPEEDAPAEEEPADESEPTEDETEPADEQETTASPPADDDTPPSELDILRALVEKQEAESSHWKALVDRQAGEIGAKQQQLIEQLRQENQRLRQAMESGDAGYAPDTPLQPNQTQPSPLTQPADEVAAYTRQTAITHAANNFQMTHPDVLVGPENARQMEPGFQQELSATLPELQNAMQSAGPVTAQQLIHNWLDDAYRKFDLQRRKEHLAELERRRANQADSSRRRKREAASASGGTPSKPKSKQLDPFKMDINELRKRLESMGPS